MALPVKRPTACTFGGDDLASLYVTTRVSLWRGARGASQSPGVSAGTGQPVAAPSCASAWAAPSCCLCRDARPPCGLVPPCPAQVEAGDGASPHHGALLAVRVPGVRGAAAAHAFPLP